MKEITYYVKWNITLWCINDSGNIRTANYSLFVSIYCILYCNLKHVAVLYRVNAYKHSCNLLFLFLNCRKNGDECVREQGAEENMWA